MSRAILAIFLASSPMRSRSVMVLTTVMIMRRSTAAGWRRAITWLQASSSSTSCRLTWRSLAITCSISSHVAGFKPVHGKDHLLLDQSAHRQHARAQALEIGIEL
jgi:hypothetical protein